MAAFSDSTPPAAKYPGKAVRAAGWYRPPAHTLSTIEQATDGILLAEAVYQAADFTRAARLLDSSLRQAAAPGTRGGPALPETLTPKESEVLNLLAEGLRNADIGARLHISVSTVRAHLRSINGKLSARSRTEAVAIGRRAGLIDR